MAVSVTDIEAMDRDQLVEVALELDRRLEDVEQEQEAQLKRFDRRTNTSWDRLSDFESAVDTLTDRVDDLEAENERLRTRVDDSGGKDAKVGKIVRYADNARGEQPAVKLTAKEIKGATGCSLRYAYDLMDDLPEEYDWFLTPQEMTQYGSIQIDNTDDRRLGVDFEGVHSAGCPLNLFNNGSTDTGGSA